MQKSESISTRIINHRIIVNSTQELFNMKFTFLNFIFPKNSPMSGINDVFTNLKILGQYYAKIPLQTTFSFTLSPFPQSEKLMFPDTKGSRPQQLNSQKPQFYGNYGQFPPFLPLPYSWTSGINNNFPSLPYYQPNYQYSEFYSMVNPSEIPNISLNVTENLVGSEHNGNHVIIKQEQEPQQILRVAREENVAVIEQKWRQKYGRNIMSNIFHIAIKKIASHQFSDHITAAILKNGLAISVREFRNKLEEKAQFTSSYISNRKMKKLLIGNPIGAIRGDIEFRKLLRIMIRLYLHNYHMSHIYHSGKIRKQSRKLHILNLRKIGKKLKKN